MGECLVTPGHDAGIPEQLAGLGPETGIKLLSLAR